MTKNSNGKSTILEIKNLSKIFPAPRSLFRKGKEAERAVHNVSFSICENEIVGLVGESGSGKTTVGRAALRLIEPTAGEIRFLGEDLRKFSSRKMARTRPQIQMVFQDPLSSLNPRKTILENIGEPLLYHKRVKTKEAMVEVVGGILQKVGIPLSALYQYPHQFSGGQQQRISIGRAISLRPKLVVCDEAVSALDLSIQAQILNLLYQLKTSLGLAYLFISHDLGVVRHLCDRVLVMHKGEIVEEGDTETLFAMPKHPYTKKLLNSIPGSHLHS